MFKFYFVFLCLISAGLAGQSFNLKWEGYKEMDYGADKDIFPYFSNHSYDANKNGQIDSTDQIISATTSLNN